MSKVPGNPFFNRRNFIKTTGLGIGAGVLGLQQAGCSGEEWLKIPQYNFV